MKFRIYIILLANLTFCNLFCQPKINSYWEFENNNVIKFGDSMQISINGRISNSECSSSICDSFGNLLFYTDGLKIWNKFHRIVKNSEGIGFPYSGIYSTSRQGALLLRLNDSQVYFFNTDFQNSSRGLNYSVININSNNDSGEVVLKKKQLVANTNEAIASINHHNNKYIWIVAHDLLTPNKFYKFLFTSNGIIECKMEQLEGPTNYNGLLSGQSNMKISPDGKYLARTVGNFCVLELFKFDNLNGKLDFFTMIESNPGDLITGIEFSKNSKFLYYVKRDSSIIQFNISEKKKKVLKWSIDGGTQQIQMAPDGNIYLVVANDTYLDAIVNCEKDSAKYIDSAIYLQGNETFTGIPSFNPSYFLNPQIDFMYEVECTKNSFLFNAYNTFHSDNHYWQIINNKSLIYYGFAKNFNYKFVDTGNYQIKYIAVKGSIKDSITKTIYIYPKIYSNFLGNDTAYAQGTAFSKNLSSPLNMHCVRWQDGSGASTFKVDTAGVYICKITNQSFCEVTDTIVINECINSLIQPNIKRSRDSLYIDQTSADSFVWFKNNVQYRISKEPFIKLTDTGSYRVEAAKKGYCNKSSNIFQVKKLGLSSYYLDDFNIQLFPNPSFEIIHIKTDKNFLLQVSDFTGRTIAIHENIDSISLPKGVYFFTFTIDAYKITEKVVVL